MIRRLVMLGTVIFIFLTSAGQAQIHGVLRVHPDNGRYFTDDDGKAILLTGSHTWSNLQDNGNGNPPPQFNYDAYIEYLQNKNHNFFRLWTWEEARWSAETKDTAYWFSPNHYVRTGPGAALDGLPKFDLTQFNQAYFDTLRQRIIRAGQRGMYVSIMLFNGWSGQSIFINNDNGNAGLDSYKGHPFNVNNNINGINGDAASTGDGQNLYTLNNSAVTSHQLAYVFKVIDETNDLDNVLYEICNEASSYSTQWQYRLIDSIHAYESRKPKQHPVGMTAQFPDFVSDNNTNSIMYASNADWISPNWYNHIENMPPTNGSKVIILDTDHIFGIGGDREWAWMAFTRGMNPIYMDPYDGKAYGCGAITDHILYDSTNTEWVLISNRLRNNMGYIRSYSQRVNLDLMVPHGELVSAPNYCLANPSAVGGEYIVFAYWGSGTNVNLTGTSSIFKIEWLNTENGAVSTGTTIIGGGNSYIASPFGLAAAVLYLYDETLLPVELISFTGSALSSNTIQLNWSTATEVNNYGFQIEKQTEKSSVFEEIPSGFVEGNGTTNRPHSYQFIDHNVQPGISSYRLKQIDSDGQWKYSNVVNVYVVPRTVALRQNYPNPFNSSTVISFELPYQLDISLVIYNTIGQEIRTLKKGILHQGTYSLQWDGRNNIGISVGSGMYFYKLDTGNKSIARKLLLLQ